MLIPLSHLHHIRERCRVHQGSQTGHEVLPDVGRGGQDMCVVRGYAFYHCGHIFSQIVLQTLLIGGEKKGKDVIDG